MAASAASAASAGPGEPGPALHALLARIATATPAQLPAVYDEVDTQVWADFADLPLVQLPVLVVLGSHLLNVRAGAYFGDLAWDEQTWGLRSP
jgi:hypothetical protein